MSNTERERKYRLTEDRVAELRQRLAAFGAWQSREAQADVFFDHPGLRLAEGDKRLRLRYHGEDGTRELTYKGPRHFENGDKLRLEISTALPGGQIEEILVQLGFNRVQQFVKLRECYRIGDAAVCIDELEPLGWFCEIEALTDTFSLDSVAAALRLNARDIEARSYAELVDESGEYATEAAI